jgi:hypothetical protein
MLAGLVCVPLALWSARNVVRGVGVLPPARGWMLPDGSEGPLGYLDWLKQWVTTQDQRSAAAFFEGTNYRLIRILPGPFLSAPQRAAATGLLSDLRAHTGEPFPASIDHAFARLADDARVRRGLGQTLALRGRQAAAFWARWAEPLPPEVRPASGGLLGWLKQALTQSLGTLLNTMARCYRCVLGVLFLAAAALAPFGRVAKAARVFVAAAISLVLAKTILGVAGLFLEARYTVTAVPFMEVAVLLVLWARKEQSESHQMHAQQNRAAGLRLGVASSKSNGEAPVPAHDRPGGWGYRMHTFHWFSESTPASAARSSGAGAHGGS